jgi:hypothetical protein
MNRHVVRLARYIRIPPPLTLAQWLRPDPQIRGPVGFMERW